MVNLQDITCQLMKPAKDLANWKFPLSEILEEYYTLLEEHCDVNFGEAALILQNSVNVYVRRVEHLLNETRCLNEMFINHEIANENDDLKCSKKNRNKNSINFDDFKLCNLVEEVGKNINTKNRFNVEKPIKLLTRRFAQLENNMDDVIQKKIEIIDIHGDIIGQKYHFRCNQYLNINGLLIDEPTQDDFGTMDMESSATSGYCSNTSVFDNSYNLESNLDSLCNTSADNNVETLINCRLSPVLGDMDCDTTIDMEDFNVSNNGIINETEDQTQNIGVKEKLTNLQNSSNSNKKLITTHDTNMNNMNNLQNQQNCVNYLFNKRPEEIKHPINMKKTINSRIWEPVPLTQNISINRKRTANLLNYTSSTISKTESRKRKIISKLHKNECTVSFLLKESKWQQRSPAHTSKRQILSQFKADEINELQKVFEDYFKNKEKPDSFQSPIPTNIINDSQEEKNSSSIRNDTFLDESAILPTSSSFLDCETRSSSPADSVISTSNDVSLQSDTQHPLPNYERLIEHEMKKLFEDSDVQTELDRKVNKWHQLIQPKLVEIEKKPIFRIHEYASRIIKKLKDKNHERVTFDNVVDGECSYEVAKYFLALLQLANTYKVDINAKESIDECIEILLLDTGKV